MYWALLVFFLEDSDDTSSLSDSWHFSFCCYVVYEQCVRVSPNNLDASLSPIHSSDAQHSAPPSSARLVTPSPNFSSLTVCYSDNDSCSPPTCTSISKQCPS